MKKTQLILTCFILFSFQFSTAQNKISGGKQTGKIATFQTANVTVGCDTIFSFPTNAGWTSGLTFDGTYFYASDFTTNFIYKYDINGIPSGTIPNPAIGSDYGGDLDYDGTYLWLLVEDDGIIYKIDPVSGTVILQYNLPTSNLSDPNTFGCAWDNGYIWITEYFDQTLMRIDPSTGAVVDSFEINRQVLPLKIINNNLYGLEVNGPTGDQLLHFDKTSGTVIDSMPWCLDYPLGFCTANNHVWGLNSTATNRVYEFDSLLISSINNPPGPSDFSIFPNPFNGSTTLELNISAQVNNAELAVYNITGQTVKVIHHISGNRVIIQRENLSPGLYFFDLSEKGNKVIRGKFVIE